jgi:hypothetical protein
VVCTGFGSSMSPTIFREGGYRFFFFSLEEARMHIHVRSGGGEAKFWLEPNVHWRRITGTRNQNSARFDRS